ncbi:hypothetical protein Tco_0433427 [Tanacetum coccineum]
MTQAQHQKEFNEFVENVNQKTYAYGDVRSRNQDLLMTISEHKAKLKSVKIGKNVNTKFDKSLVLGKLVCVTSLNKNKDQKSKFVPKIDVKQDVSKPVTSCSSPKLKKSNTNVIVRGMYKVKTKETSTSSEKTNVIYSNSTGVVKSISVSRLTHQSTDVDFAAALAILVTRASQSRQHESRKSPTVELFDVDSGRISIITVNTKEYHSEVLANITRIMRRNLAQVVSLMMNNNCILEYVS